MTADAAAVAHASRIELLMGRYRGRCASETCIHRLAERPQRLGAGVELVGERLSRVSLEGELGGDEVLRRLGVLRPLGHAGRPLKAEIVLRCHG